MLIELQVSFYPENYDPEEDETLARKTKPEIGPLMVNTDHVVAFNPLNKGKKTRIRLTNSESYEANMPYEQFKAIMEDAIADQIYIPYEN